MLVENKKLNLTDFVKELERNMDNYGEDFRSPLYSRGEYTTARIGEGEYFAEDEEVVSQIARFLVESSILQETDEMQGNESHGRLRIIISPIWFYRDGNTYAEDYCVSPKLIITKVEENKVLVDFYEAVPFGTECCDSKEFLIDIEAIKNSIEYKVTQGVEEKTNEELALEIKQIMNKYDCSEYDCDEFIARHKLINKYGQDHHARLTRIMYNLAFEEEDGN